MKILMLIDRLDVGGAESHLVTLTRALRARGHTVHIFAERGAWSHRAQEAGAVCFCPPAPLTGRGFFAAVLPCVLFLRRLMRHNGYDILHAHTRRTAFLLRLAGRPPFCARIVTCHARFSPRHRRLCYWGDATVAVSEDLLAHLVDTFALARRRVRVIPNGIDTRHFSPAGRIDSPDDWRVTFASRLDLDCSTAARHLLSLCEEWQERILMQGKRLSVTVLGGGEAFEELCKQASAVNERAGRALVHMAGAVDDPAPVFRQTDLFVGVSRAAIEALFCGATVLLAGDEGMAGLLTADNFERASKTNFCCRGMTPLTREGLDAAFRAFLACDDAHLRAQNAHLQEVAAPLLGAECMGRKTEAVYGEALALRRPRRWLVAGYAGCGNLGDDAILRRLIAEIRTNDPDATVCATVCLPADARHRFDGAHLIDRRSPLSLLRAMRRSDALLLGGGCLLQNCSAHGGRSLFYYLTLARLARLCRRPVLWVAAGVGPLRGRLARRAVGRVLRRADYVSVRDAASRRLLISLGVPAERIHRRADPVLSITPAGRQAASAFLEAHLPQEARGRRYLCIAPRAGCASERELADALARLHEEAGIYPLFLAFDRTEDAPVCRRLMAACGAGVCLPCDDEALIAALFALPCVLGVAAGRLHALILACVGGAEAVALIGEGEDGKVAGFAASVGFEILEKGKGGADVLAALLGAFNRGDE